MKDKMQLLTWVTLIQSFTASCVYRFSNENIKRPEGIRTIAVESVYDTSKGVLHHDHLWTGIQEAVGMDGHLRLESRNEADALIRTHVREYGVTSAGEQILNGPRKDPSSQNLTGPLTPESYGNLNTAGVYQDLAGSGMKVDVEVYSLRTGNLLLQKTYSASHGFRAVHQTRGREFTTAANDFIRFDEASEAGLKAMGLSIGRSIVSDLLKGG